MSDEKLKLDEASLELVLNLALDNLKEDRLMALEHHSTLREHMRDGGWGDQLTIQEIAGALSNFLGNAALSVDRALKIAKILADLLTKMDADNTLTDEDRANIENMIVDLGDEKDNINNDTSILDIENFLDSGEQC